MSDFIQAVSAHVESAKHFDKADMMRRYIAVTEQHGPSQALIDFINDDKSFAAEIGLESFDSLSAGTQHELILTKIDPSAAESMGIESFRDALKKYRWWLVAGGLTLVGWPLLVAGIAGIIAKKSDEEVVPRTAFEELVKSWTDDFKDIEDIVNKIPDDLSDEHWGVISRASETPAGSPDDLQRLSDSRVAMKKSGWSAVSFTSLMRWHDDAIKNQLTLQRAADHKLAKIDALIAKDPDASRIASKGVSSIMKMLHDTNSVLKQVKPEIARIAACFESK